MILTSVPRSNLIMLSRFPLGLFSLDLARQTTPWSSPAEAPSLVALLEVADFTTGTFLSLHYPPWTLHLAPEISDFSTSGMYWNLKFQYMTDFSPPIYRLSKNTHCVLHRCILSWFCTIPLYHYTNWTNQKSRNKNILVSWSKSSAMPPCISAWDRNGKINRQLLIHKKRSSSNNNYWDRNGKI